MRYPDPAQANSFVSGSRASGVSQIWAGSQGICGVYILLTPIKIRIRARPISLAYLSSEDHYLGKRQEIYAKE